MCRCLRRRRLLRICCWSRTQHESGDSHKHKCLAEPSHISPFSGCPGWNLVRFLQLGSNQLRCATAQNRCLCNLLYAKGIVKILISAGFPATLEMSTNHAHRDLLPAGVFLWSRNDLLECRLLGKGEFRHRDHIAVAATGRAVGEIRVTAPTLIILTAPILIILIAIRAFRGWSRTAYFG